LLAGIREFDERTGSRLAPGRRAYAHINVHAMKCPENAPAAGFGGQRPVARKFLKKPAAFPCFILPSGE
jgi:hypothetical protein